MSEILGRIRAELPGLRLLTDETDRESYRSDEASYLKSQLPMAVALPESADQVSAIVRLAAEHRTPIVPRGTGTGLSGASGGIEGAITVAFTRMNRILEIDRANMVAVVQPGVINADLKAAVAKEGLFYPPDPASFEMCSIGGNIGTNAGGLCCVKYGVTRDSVLGLEVVLADGSVIRTGGRNVKDVAGYALTHLFVGSQGTLGLVTEATLRLRPAPPPKATLLAFFADTDGAGDAVERITAAGLVPCTLELMDRITIRAVNDAFHLELPDAAALLLIESDLPGVAAEGELDAASAAAEAAGAVEQVRATNAMEADGLRQARRLALRAMEKLGATRMEDVGAPRSKLVELLNVINRVVAERGLNCGTFGHAGDGNLHPTFWWQRGDAEAEARVTAACEELYRAAIDLGGTVTGEHGIGVARLPFLELQRGPGAVRVMRQIKSALDPLNLLNPGRAI
ncbi:MAG: FAD-binding protein [Chloroflexi bacterium]|nr:MAG: FAD-binding protein [Chloroflexota bacterium]